MLIVSELRRGQPGVSRDRGCMRPAVEPDLVCILLHSEDLLRGPRLNRCCIVDSTRSHRKTGPCDVLTRIGQLLSVEPSFVMVPVICISQLLFRRLDVFLS